MVLKLNKGLNFTRHLLAPHLYLYLCAGATYHTTIYYFFSWHNFNRIGPNR